MFKLVTRNRKKIKTYDNRIRLNYKWLQSGGNKKELSC